MSHSEHVHEELFEVLEHKTNRLNVDIRRDRREMLSRLDEQMWLLATQII